MTIEITTNEETLRIENATKVAGSIEISTPDLEYKLYVPNVLKYEVIEGEDNGNN